jgi:MFS transporter, BCD family, chlorophyll transporter
VKTSSLPLAHAWTRLHPQLLPFLAPGSELTLLRLLRLSLFQLTVGMAAALLIGTLNRVMILEMGMAAWLVSAMVALPLLFAPFRALVGFRSDTHRSVLGWRRVPYLWAGTLIQFGGLAIMPFALILLSGDSRGPAWLGHASAALAFLMTGAGMQITQTAGLALATDQANDDNRPAVVALMQVMLLVGMVASGLVFGLLLRDFSAMRLIQVVQGAAVLTMVVNLYALWKQEVRGSGPAVTPHATKLSFSEHWRIFAGQPGALRLLVTLGLGTAGFSMQDIILEPYGGEVLGLSVAATTQLTAMSAGGGLAAFALAAHWLGRGWNAHRITALGALVGIAAFCAVIFAAPLGSAGLFRIGAVLIGFGGGLFAVGTLSCAMVLETGGLHGLALGAWGAVQACALGIATGLGGTLRDVVSGLATHGQLGEVLGTTATGYSFVYHLEIALLFATLIAVGPLVRRPSTNVHAPVAPPNALQS